jgi:hypothetical protein
LQQNQREEEGGPRKIWNAGCQMRDMQNRWNVIWNVCVGLWMISVTWHHKLVNFINLF